MSGVAWMADGAGISEGWCGPTNYVCKDVVAAAALESLALWTHTRTRGVLLLQPFRSRLSTLHSRLDSVGRQTKGPS